ncbi:hypothetical protein AURDEDRAFT_131033 [Auricularia subglabra TFB-10046 SS5]|uniref:Uncharacterized protein n=1 Tax=Auricularia subglabra (strain TFB-10046 / SS5) TaxID=717982 RepID=J0WRQ6_AURST|nr:hypothetical protein AURDEDRAFT_131033 [Auricularia subglabra TFB-10046 SS5]
MAFRIQNPESNVRTVLPEPVLPETPPIPEHLKIAPPPVGYISAQLEEDARAAEAKAARYGPVPPKLVVPPRPGMIIPPAPDCTQPAAALRPQQQFPASMVAPKLIPGHTLYTADYQCPYAECRQDGKILVCDSEEVLKEHNWKVPGLF